MDEAVFSRLKGYQFWLLVIVSALIVYAAPTHWFFNPDAGVHLGTTESMLNSGRYEFNSHPNLLYYPGYPLLLAVPVALFGIDFHILHLYSAFFAIASLWLVRAYFTTPNYGVVGLLLPFLLFSLADFQEATFKLYTDTPFMVSILLSLLLWRKFEQSNNNKFLYILLIVVSFASLIRFHGVFLIVAAFVALLIKDYKENTTSFKTISIAVMYGFVASLPFLLWSYRNFTHHDPDTYTMFNRYIFKLDSLQLYAANSFQVDWIDSRWKYGIYNLVFSVRDIAEGILGEHFVKRFSPFSVFGFVAALFLLGANKWFRFSTAFEKAIFSLLLGFTLFWVLKAGSLHVITRYWLPLMPFFLLILSSSFENIISWVKHKKLKSLLVSVSIVPLMLVISAGVSNFHKNSSKLLGDYIQKSNQVMSQLSQYINENTDVTEKIATTDWGVLPYFLNRECYPILNGRGLADKDLYEKEYIPSMRRILKYHTTHLVLYDAAYARKMAENYPDIFKLEYSLKLDNRDISAMVYYINLELLKSRLSLNMDI